jgi:hypothetical protein
MQAISPRNYFLTRAAAGKFVIIVGHIWKEMSKPNGRRLHCMKKFSEKWPQGNGPASSRQRIKLTSNAFYYQTS